jgi:iron(III) transport system permease protein
MTTEAGSARASAGFREGGLGNALRRVAQPRTLVIGLVVLIIAYLAVAPLFYLLHDTFVGTSGVNLGVFSRAYGGNTQAGEMIANSLVFAFGSTLLSLALGTMLAYVQVRTDAPFKGLFFAASLVPLIIPGILYSIAWVFLADAKIGLINTLIFKPVLGHGLFNVYSLWGMVWVQGLHNAPVAFLLMVAAFRAMDPSLEESALVCGASWRMVLRCVTVPLLRSALIAAVLLVFVQSLESFEVPAILGLQAGIYVFTSRIYFELHSFPIDYGVAGAYACGLLLVAVLGVLCSSWLSRGGRGHQTITGKAFRPRPLRLGRARPFVGAAVVLYFAVTVLAPVAILVYGSLLKFYRPPSMEAFKSFTLQTYAAIAHDQSAATSLRNTFLLGVGSATAVMLLTSVASWFVVRTTSRGRRLLDILAFTPLAIPGIVLGLALSFVYLRTPLPIYGTLWILLIAYSTRYLPYGMRYAGSALAQISVELEESAYVCGASWWRSFRQVLMPLASSGLLAGWIYVLIVSFRELSSTVLLYSPGRETLSVLIFQQFENGAFSSVAAIGVLMVALLVVLVLVAYRIGARVGVTSDMN